MRVSKDQLAAALRRAGTTIPDAFYFGVVDHESAWKLDEQTVETTGAVALGLFQILNGEVAQHGDVGAFLVDIDRQAELMVERTEDNRARIREAAGVPADALDPWDTGAYLALAHNEGIGAALQTIEAYGMDWDAYKARNPGRRINAYGDDCLYDPLTGRSTAPHRAANLAIGMIAVFGALWIALGSARAS